MQSIPGMPAGKPAGVPCAQLDAALRCRIFGAAERPVADLCGGSAGEAMALIGELERLTANGET
ncbi:Fe-S-cluster oxidoreductase [Endothiovibrio diazotrophicus]